MVFVVRELREKKGISQVELSRLSNVSRQTINGLETGKVTVSSTGTLQKIAKALDIEIQSLFLGS